MLTQEAEAVGVVDEDAEIVFILESHDLVELAEGPGHAVDTLGDEQDATAVLVSLLASPRENLLAIGHVVVAILVLAADVEPDAVQKTGVALGVIDDDVVAGGQGVDGRDYALVAEVVEEGVLLLLEVGEYPLELLMIAGVAGHHPSSHRVSESPVGRRLGVRLPDLGMVGQAEVVVQVPVQDRNPVECHVRPELAFEAGVHVITETLLKILADRAAGISFDPVKNVKHVLWL